MEWGKNEEWIQDGIAIFNQYRNYVNQYFPFFYNITHKNIDSFAVNALINHHA